MKTAELKPNGRASAPGEPCSTLVFSMSRDRRSSDDESSFGSGKKPPRLIYNPLSLAGASLAVAAMSTGLFLSLAEVLLNASTAYGGLVYGAVGLFFLLGLGLIACGMRIESSRRRKGRRPFFAVRLAIDFERFAKPRPVGGFLLGVGVVVLCVLTVGKAVTRGATFMESNTFCGSACHEVMGPEFAVYALSPHARIECVRCHVGSNPESYLRSKLNGLRQLWALASGTVQRPIPTPIQDQRPSREMCEQCHWPSRQIGTREIVRSYSLSDEENSRRRVRLLIDIGGASPDGVAGSGIHYHMSLDHTVEYIARDLERQQIAWVRITHPDGTVEEFEDLDAPLSEEEAERLELRVMDCLDCHNRPAHRFTAPLTLMNRALEEGTISRELPYIKVEGARALQGEYEHVEAAEAAIAARLMRFYREEYPERFEQLRGEIERGIKALQAIYRANIFPGMKADSFAHPDNLGHLNWDGCFRCHSDTMESDEGNLIFTTCERCHIVIAQGGRAERVKSHTEGLAFVHPEDETTIEEFTECTDCHTGGAELYE